ASHRINQHPAHDSAPRRLNERLGNLLGAAAVGPDVKLKVATPLRRVHIGDDAVKRFLPLVDELHQVAALRRYPDGAFGHLRERLKLRIEPRPIHQAAMRNLGQPATNWWVEFREPLRAPLTELQFTEEQIEQRSKNRKHPNDHDP